MLNIYLTFYIGMILYSCRKETFWQERYGPRVGPVNKEIPCEDAWYLQAFLLTRYITIKKVEYNHSRNP